MRPRQLLLQGFTVFRSMDRPVSFVEADLFALTGPTGSGKTTVLDAMCFALYGRVPRLDARAVEPIISLGAQEARILFEFSVGDDVYTAARVVRRTKSGASTPEARLELHATDGERVPVASGADEMNETVATLLGLTFDQFTKTVLLPQGAFAAFLHDTPARRQDLLRTLLDLGMYDRMRERAQHRKSRAEGEAAALRNTLEQLSVATDEAEQRAAALVTGLAGSLATIRELQPQIERLSAEISEAGRAIEAEAQLLGALEQLHVPDTVTAMSRAIEAAESSVAGAEKALAAATESVVGEEKELAAMPEIGDLISVDAQWRRRGELVERLERGQASTEEAVAAVRSATERLTADTGALEAAQQAWVELETRHRGHTLATEVEVGSDCPVCLRTIERLPDHGELPGLDAARARREAAALDARNAVTAEAQARTHLDACERTLASIRSDLDGVDRMLDGKPGAEEIALLLAELRERTRRLGDLRDEERRCRAVLEETRSALAEARGLETAGRRLLSEVRDRLASAAPPKLAMEDLVADWRTLVTWAGDRSVELRQDLADAAKALGELEALRARHHDSVERQLAHHGLESTEGAPVERVVAALADAEQSLGRIRADREAAERTEKQLGDVAKRSEVAASMARHLQASGFESWLMEEALHGLIAGANVLLRQLSSGAYSLEMVKRDFAVIDHRNADETRGVKTLSGGETFLVSLALALSLAEQIGTMAAGGAARLDSIFLDEGFGTLDADTLDIVAAVIQELGASGRTVGIVTHVTELAELVPTRFEVVRAMGGSAVRRVDT